MMNYIVLIFLGFAGFLLSLYIWHKKRRREHMVCPLRANCTAVITSEFSTFFGIPVEALGMAYYLVAAVGYGVLAAVTGVPEVLSYALLSLAALGALFSLYLTFIQVFTLRELCTWCLLSAAISVSIFVFALLGSLEHVVPFLERMEGMLASLHVLSVAVGLGTATVADVLFFKFLKDFRISKKESVVLGTTSQIIWTAIGFILLTGLGLVLANLNWVFGSAAFQLKMIVVGVIIVNGAFLNLVIAPKLMHITFGRKHDHRRGELHAIRRAAFVLGPISLVSWYSAFTLGAMRGLPLSFGEGLLVYAGLLLLGVIGGAAVEKILDMKAKKAVE